MATDSDDRTSELDMRREWEREKLAFGRDVLAQTRRFLEIDMVITQHLGAVTATLAKYAEAHPDQIFGPAGARIKVSLPDFEVLNPLDVGRELLDTIKTVLLAEKEFIQGLVDRVLPF